jgi:UDP:flavonoid glycosyltransferase YjiC (YdhE family)
MSHILFTTFGSYGDLHPYIALGLELRTRGHRVTIATSPTYREKVEAEGIEFHPVRPDINLNDDAIIAYCFHPRRGMRARVAAPCGGGAGEL